MDVPANPYLFGYDRSGSTLLDWLMDSHPAVFGIGEVGRLPHCLEPGTPIPEFCACGEALDACTVWGPILEKTRVLDWRSMSFDDFNDFLLNELVAAKPEAEVVFDSSGHLPRLRRLTHGRFARQVPVKVVYLTRDVRGVVYSASKRGYRMGANKQSIVRAAAGWWMRNRQYLNFVETLPKTQYIHVRYEELVADPDVTLRRVQRFVGVEELGLIEDWKLLTHHTFAGNNRLRKSKHTTIRSDEKWRRGLSPMKQLLVTTIAGRVNKRLSRGLNA